jgi:uncharacterized protein (TIGR03067 family)
MGPAVPGSGQPSAHEKEGAAMKLWVLLGLVASGLLGLGGLAGEGRKRGGELEGTWLTTEIHSGGKKLAREEVEKLQLTVTVRGDRYTVTVQGKVQEEGTFTADASPSPNTLDLKIDTGKNKGKTQHGIYRVDGDTLRVSFAPAGVKERPGALTFEKGSLHQTLTLKRLREKKDSK